MTEQPTTNVNQTLLNEAFFLSIIFKLLRLRFLLHILPVISHNLLVFTTSFFFFFSVSDLFLLLFLPPHRL